jgi:hypothetical protein
MCVQELPEDKSQTKGLFEFTPEMNDELRQILGTLSKEDVLKYIQIAKKVAGDKVKKGYNPKTKKWEYLHDIEAIANAIVYESNALIEYDKDRGFENFLRGYHYVDAAIEREKEGGGELSRAIWKANPNKGRTSKRPESGRPRNDDSDSNDDNSDDNGKPNDDFVPHKDRSQADYRTNLLHKLFPKKVKGQKDVSKIIKNKAGLCLLRRAFYCGNIITAADLEEIPHYSTFESDVYKRRLFFLDE